MPVPGDGIVASRYLLREQAHDHIRDAILDGTLKAGERLRDDSLVAWLGVSRTPIREALATLADEGLVDMVSSRYTRVTLPDPSAALHTLRALGVITGGIVRLTVPELTPPQRQEALDRLSDELRQLQAGGTMSIVCDVDRSYQAWLALCPNPSLVYVGTRMLHGLAYKLRVDTIGDTAPTDHLIEHLTKFRTAIGDNDPVAAELAIEAAHMLEPTIPPLPRRPICERAASHPPLETIAAGASYPRKPRSVGHLERDEDIELAVADASLAAGFQ